MKTRVLKERVEAGIIGMKKQRIGMVVLALVALCACPSVVVDPHYQGVPVASLKGQLSLAQGVVPPNNVRLAVVWYKSFLQPTQPDSIVTQEVAFKGTFPSNFTFDFYGVPPAEALNPTKEGNGHQAFGVLVAYEDSNGDGRLDPADPFDDGGVNNDRLLGATSSYFDVNTTSYWIQYSDVTPAASDKNWPSGSKKGFNLVSNSQDANGRGHAEVLPFDTSIPLVLTAENELVALICQADFANDIGSSPNPIELCKHPATPNVLRVNGSFRRSYTDDDATGALVTADRTTLTLSDGQAYVDNATVTVNGQLARFRSEGFYDSSASLTPGAPNVAVVNAPGFAPVTISLVMPNQMPLLAPVSGQKIKSGSSLKIEWPQATPLAYRLIYVTSADFLVDLGGPNDALGNTDVTSGETAPIRFVGSAVVNMKSQGAWTSDRFGSYFSSSVSQQRSIELTE